MPTVEIAPYPPNVTSQVTPMVTMVQTKITDSVHFGSHLIPLMEFYKRSSRTSLLGDQHISRPLRRLKWQYVSE